MNLLLDMGNSRLKWCWQDGRRRLASGAVALSGLSADRPPAAWADQPAPDRVLAVSVANEASWRILCQIVLVLWGREVERVKTPAQGGGIRCAYPDPARLGADRWVAMVAARALGELPALVVDCGTAITFDWVDAGGEHRGGLIAAGVATQIEALGRRAPALAGVSEKARLELFATDTESAILGGAVFGTAAVIEGLSGRMEAALGVAASRWLAGGDAAALHPHLPAGRFSLRPELVLDGLAVLAEGDR